jgi:hypothetical protein
MLDSMGFWLAQNCALGLFYLVAQTHHWVVLVAAVLLAAHVLELPLAFRVLRERQASAPRVLLLTVLFGFTWWLPARRGIYAVK